MLSCVYDIRASDIPMKISVLGGGTIGSAIAEALHKNGHNVTVTRRSVEKISGLAKMGIQVTSRNDKAAEDSEIIIIAMKPYDALAVLKELSGATKGKLVISMVAAVKEKQIRSLIPEATVVRAMTNVAARVGGGFTVYCSKSLTEENEKNVVELLKCFGETEKVEEKYMDALTALGGSGPAYIFTIIEAMVYGGLKVGLPRDLALRDSYQTIMGAAKLVAESGDHPSQLKDLVTTPGGVTIDALYELEDSGIRTAFMRAIEAATDKARMISDALENFDGQPK